MRSLNAHEVEKIHDGPPAIPGQHYIHVHVHIHVSYDVWADQRYVYQQVCYLLHVVYGCVVDWKDLLLFL